MGLRDAHIHKYEKVMVIDGTLRGKVRKMCLICGKMK